MYLPPKNIVLPFLFFLPIIVVRSQSVDSEVSFNSNFEGGRLGKITQVAKNHWQCELSGESDSENRNRQASWYYFSVAGAINQPITIELTKLVGEYNYRYGSTALSDQTRPVISYDQIHWRHLTDNEVQWNNEDTTLVFSFTPLQNTVWIAHVPPYTTKSLNRLLKSYQSTPLVRLDTVGRTPENRPLILLTLTNAQIPINQKKVIWLMARQHSWEAGTSWVMEGLIRFLLDSASDQGILDRIVFKLIPMGDPDGVARGGVRFNQFGHDLNRNWDYVIPEEMPEIHAQKTAIEDWLAEGKPIDLFLTLHNTEDDYVRGPDLPIGHRLWKEMVELSSFDAPEGLRNMPESTTVGQRGRMNVNQALWSERKIPAYLMELNVDRVEKLEGYRTVDDWLKLGAQLAKALTSVVE